MVAAITRSEARARGLRFYFTGAPCRNGEIAERLVSDGRCRCAACSKERLSDRAPYFRRYRKKWAYEAADKARDYYARSGHVVLAAKARRRARKLNATATWDADLTNFVMQEAADLARRREAATGFAWHVDHMVPLQARNACGLHTWSNLQVIPAAMNVQKNNRMLLTWPGEWVRAA